VQRPTKTFGAKADLLVPPYAVGTLAHSVAAGFVQLRANNHGIPLNPEWTDATAAILE
jgi:hypothetical protein